MIGEWAKVITAGFCFILSIHGILDFLPFPKKRKYKRSKNIISQEKLQAPTPGCCFMDGIKRVRFQAAEFRKYTSPKTRARQ